MIKDRRDSRDCDWEFGDGFLVKYMLGIDDGDSEIMKRMCLALIMVMVE